MLTHSLIVKVFFFIEGRVFMKAYPNDESPNGGSAASRNGAPNDSICKRRRMESLNVPPFKDVLWRDDTAASQ